MCLFKEAAVLLKVAASEELFRVPGGQRHCLRQGWMACVGTHLILGRRWADLPFFLARWLAPGRLSLRRASWAACSRGQRPRGPPHRFAWHRPPSARTACLAEGHQCLPRALPCQGSRSESSLPFANGILFFIRECS